MLNLSMQFFAHKKGSGSTKNGRDSESKNCILRFNISYTSEIFVLIVPLKDLPRKSR